MDIKVCDRCGKRIVGGCGSVNISFIPPPPHHVDKRVTVRDMELCDSCCYELFDTFKILEDKLIEDKWEVR